MGSREELYTPLIFKMQKLWEYSFVQLEISQVMLDPPSCLPADSISWEALAAVVVHISVSINVTMTTDMFMAVVLAQPGLCLH